MTSPRLIFSPAFNWRICESETRYSGPFNAIAFRSGAVRAHLRRTGFGRDALPNAICALTYQVIANLLRANSVSNFVQDVVEFVVLHDLTPNDYQSVFSFEF